MRAVNEYLLKTIKVSGDKEYFQETFTVINDRNKEMEDT